MTTDTVVVPTASLSDLPGSLGVAVAELGGRVRLHDLYDARGSRVYDDSAHLDPGEVRVLRRVLRTHPGPVLELAAGSGRLTLPLLTMGRDVVALELSSSMVGVLEEKALALPEPVRRRLTVHQGDMTDFDLGAQFSVVILGAASISLLDADSRARMFDVVRRHLAPGGVMLFSLAVFRGDDEGDVDQTFDLTGRSGRQYRVHEHRRAGSVDRVIGIYPMGEDGPVADEDGVVPVCIGNHRLLDLEPILREVEAAGFVVRERHTVESPGQPVAELFLEISARA